METEMVVSVVILTWNSEKYVKNCIESVFNEASPSNISIEIIVVDNGSTDGTVKILTQFQEKCPNLKIIKLKKNLGTTVPRNIAIKKSSGKYIFILDSDTEVQPSTLKTLLEIIESDSRIGIVAPRLLYPDNTVQSSCKKFPTAKIKFYKFLPSDKFHRVAEQEELYNPVVYSENFNKIINVDYCISAAWMVNRKAIEYNPKVKVIHYTQRISHKSFKMVLSHAKGLLYYFAKHRYLFNRERIYRKIREVMEDE